MPVNVASKFTMPHFVLDAKTVSFREIYWQFAIRKMTGGAIVAVFVLPSGLICHWQIDFFCFASQGHWARIATSP
jgi:hypothetical protein